ncbi:uncharacterized protein TNCV_330621 [Trichonephila clavipes]|nr:uncharacterized protein TNCV_330621 [Trichonephila clavipes]
MGREDVPQSTKRSNEAERRRGEGKNAGRKAGRPKAVNQDAIRLEVMITAAVAEWYRYRTVACFVTGSSPVPLKTLRVGQRCTLNLSRAETSSRWCGVVVRRGGASSGVVHVT